MSEAKRDYKIGYGKPPWGRPFQKGRPATRAACRKDLSALLITALNEPGFVTTDGRRCKTTKRETSIVVARRSGVADLLTSCTTAVFGGGSSARRRAI
jgi:hypothetical protein